MLKEFLCVVVSYGRQFIIDVMALDSNDAFEQAESMGFECYSVSESGE